ncbi:hypothetical protein SO802_017548 [Lithocarpus litseifolius]|uniref:Reverse transcriptase zinc-binding domain-containing protein n=1 Tax=Lithocarpus litseifolius TaxID=425828 RepID=A0AAW2CLN4_9ROSI
MDWEFTPKGEFIEHSAYKLALEMVHDGNFGEASNNKLNKPFRKTIWRLNVTNKVKSFAWHASKNIIQTKANLCHLKVIDNPTCEACGLGAESSGHVLWDCEKAQGKLFGIPFEVRGAKFPEFVNLLWHLKFRQKMGDDLLELVVLVSWCLWFNRNEVRLGKARLLEVRLEPLSDPWYKINNDAAIFESTSSIRVGAIIRDHDGQVEVALSKALLVPLGPLEANEKALEESILFALDVGVRDVIFETPKLFVMQKLDVVNHHQQ